MTSTRKNITQPAEWWDAFDEAARTEGESLSEWIGRLCLRGLPKEKKKQLPDRPLPWRPKKES